MHMTGPRFAVPIKKLRLSEKRKEVSGKRKGKLCSKMSGWALTFSKERKGGKKRDRNTGKQNERIKDSKRESEKHRKKRKNVMK